MNSVQSPLYDVIIIGAGAAGLRTALEAWEHTKNILILSKDDPIVSASYLAQGGVAAALNNAHDGDTPELHAQDTMASGKGLSDKEAVDLLCHNGPKEMHNLDKLGAPFSRRPDGSIAQRPYGGHSKIRACYSQDYIGRAVHGTLLKHVLQKGIPLQEDAYVTKILTHNNHGVGVEILKGNIRKQLSAKSIVIATGGIGQMYEVSTAPKVSTGDGLKLAVDLGVTLRDMEMIQFHPTGLYPSGILISEACRSEGGHLINSKGERFMYNYDDRGELATRDVVARANQTEILEGRGINDINAVGLDIRHLGKNAIDELLPGVKKNAMDLLGIDVETQIMPVAPTMHFLMGGIPVSIKGEVKTSTKGEIIPGVYAVGEVACLSIHGANRLGCNSILECVVFGKETGEHAARYALSKNSSQIHSPLNPETMVSDNLSIDKLNTLHEQLKILMTSYLGVFRSQAGMTTAKNKLSVLQQKFESLSIPPSKPFYEFEGMLKIAHIILKSALQRKESLGAHTIDETKS